MPGKFTTLEDHCSKGDGTYDGRKAVQWLFEAVTGKTLSLTEVEDLWAAAKEKANERTNAG